MTADTSPSVPFWSPTGLTSVLLVVAALAASLSAWVYSGQAARRVQDVEVQTEIARAYQYRAIACLDHAAASLADPALRAFADSGLEVSRGITLCLVKNRHRGVVQIDDLAACVREVEIVNGLLDPSAGAASAPPPC